VTESSGAIPLLNRPTCVRTILLLLGSTKRAHKDSLMPITAGVDRDPQAENHSHAAAPHPEEIKATFDLAMGSTVSFKPLSAPRRLAWLRQRLRQRAVLLPTVSLAKAVLRERRYA
jgi:hypothetical protein